MSVPDDTQDQREVQHLHRQGMDARIDGRYADQEESLKEAKKSAQRLEKLPLLVKESYWLADAQRQLDKYAEAINDYKFLVDLTSDPVYRSKLDDPSSLYYLTGAFIYFIECGRHLPDFFLPERQVEVLQRKVDEGLLWLGQVERSQWAAGLRLQWGLLLKSQKDLKRAREELTEALRLAQAHPEAPGYTLATYQLELADLLCNIDACEQAVPLANGVLSKVGSSTSDRKRACKILFYASVELGDMSIAYSLLNEEQKFVPTTESVRDVDKQPGEQFQQQVDRAGEAIVSPDQTKRISEMEISLRKIIADEGIEYRKRLSEMEISLKKAMADEDIEHRKRLSEMEISLRKAVADEGIEHRKRLSEMQFHISANQRDQPAEIQVPLDAAQSASNTKEPIKSNDTEYSDDPKHIQCLVALPTKGENDIYQTVLLPALRTALELDPYYWQVVSIYDRYFDDIKQRNVLAWLQHTHAYLADISEENSDVMLQLGSILARKNEQPLLLLKRKDSTYAVPDILEGFARISYSCRSESNEHAIKGLAEDLKEEFAKHEAIKKLNRTKQFHYLSPLFICKISPLSNEIAEKLSKAFTTMEKVRDADENDFSSRAIACGLTDGFEKIVKEKIIATLPNQMQRTEPV